MFGLVEMSANQNSDGLLKSAAGAAAMLDDTSGLPFNKTAPLDSLQNDTRLSALHHLRKESLDIYNRLHSIAEDIEFVKSVRAAYPHLPILRECYSIILQVPHNSVLMQRSANQRCGLWYVDPRMVRATNDGQRNTF